MQMKVLGRISIRVMGAGMYGCQVTEPHPCPGKHGLYFQKKNMGPLPGSITPKISRKKGYIFQEQSLKMGIFSCQNDP